MKRLFLLLITLICIGFTVFYLLSTYKKSLIPRNEKVSQESKTGEVINKKRAFEGLIKKVKFDNCEIEILSSDGKNYVIGEISGGGKDGTVCLTEPKYQISDSGKYLVFEDLSGGVDLWVRVFSVTTKTIDTLAVWGTSWLLDLEFLPNDKLAILSGYPEIPQEQWLSVINLPALYEKYPDTIDDNGYFKYDILNDNSKELDILETQGDYFMLFREGNSLILHGGNENDPVVRGTFQIDTL